ncbi:MAG TPA: hypothetical protein VIS73_02015 [Rhodocyclaceae bacterium]
MASAESLQAFGKHPRAVGPTAEQERGELSAAEATSAIGLAQALANGFGECAQDEVDGSLAVGIVDSLEVVKVEHPHDSVGTGPLEAGEVLFEPLHQVSSIGQPVQQISLCHPRQFFLKRVALGDVALHAEVTDDATPIVGKQLEMALRYACSASLSCMSSLTIWSTIQRRNSVENLALLVA